MILWLLIVAVLEAVVAPPPLLSKEELAYREVLDSDDQIAEVFTTTSERDLVRLQELFTIVPEQMIQVIAQNIPCETDCFKWRSNSYFPIDSTKRVDFLTELIRFSTSYTETNGDVRYNLNILLSVDVRAPV